MTSPGPSSVRAAGDRTLSLAAWVSVLLSLLKFTVGLLSGSMVLLASAADSFTDALMSRVNLWGYRQARVPADAGHPYGHGKLEGAFAVGQGMLLIGIVVSLVAACVIALVRGHPVPQVDIAVVALIASGIVAAWLTWMLRGAASREHSVVLEADAAHYAMDMLSAAGAVAGLLAVRATGWAWLDPAASLVMAALMLRESSGVLRRGLAELLDEALPEDELERVAEVLERNKGRVVAFHGLRTRRGGPLRFVEVHAVLPSGISLGDAHDLVQDIGLQIRGVLPASRVLVLPDADGMADSVDDCLEPPGCQS